MRQRHHLLRVLMLGGVCTLSLALAVAAPLALANGGRHGSGGVPVIIHGTVPSHGIQPHTSVTVDEDAGNVFNPKVLTVPAGTTVIWVNADTSHTPHTSTSDTGLWDSGNMSQGQSFQFTFNTPGTFNYGCSYHKSLGMTGQVIVTAAAPTNTPVPASTNTPVPTNSPVPPTDTVPAGAPTSTPRPIVPTSTPQPGAPTSTPVPQKGGGVPKTGAPPPATDLSILAIGLLFMGGGFLMFLKKRRGAA